MAKATVLAEDGMPNEAASVTHDGMTLRDYFAAKAMQSLLQDECTGEWKASLTTDAAYRVADAMLESRKS